MRLVSIALCMFVSSAAFAQQPIPDCIKARSAGDYLKSIDPFDIQLAKNTLGDETFDSLAAQIEGLSTNPGDRPWLSVKFSALALLQPESAIPIARLVRGSTEGSFERLQLVAALVQAGTVESQCRLAKIAEGKNYELSLRTTVIGTMNFIKRPNADTFARIERLSESQDDEDVVSMARLLLQNLRNAAN